MGYVLTEGVKGLGRNITMTVALIITSAISLALLATGILVTEMTADTKAIYLDRVEVMVQLNEDISANDRDCSSPGCREVLSELESHSDVVNVTFRSREQSYQRFVELFQETDPILVQETSPDALPAALHVQLEDPMDTASLERVRSMDQVVDVIDQAQDLQSATQNLDSVRNASFILAFVQAIAAIFLIANMVQIAAFNRREEVSIMRMVGASRLYTQMPFVLEAVFATVIGAVVAVLGMWAGKELLLDKALGSLYEARLIAPITTADIWAAWPWVLLIGVVFAAVTAHVTLRLYVRR